MSQLRETEHAITMNDIGKLLGGEGGVDLVPIMKDGKQVAMRIIGVRPGTTADRLGARNDDTIESINDVPLDSIPAAYRAGDLASRQQRIIIRGTRGGVPYVTTLTVANAPS